MPSMVLSTANALLRLFIQPILDLAPDDLRIEGEDIIDYSTRNPAAVVLLGVVMVLSPGEDS